MATVLVSIVSDHNIPNILLIKDLPLANRYLFISSAKMEEKDMTKNIVNVCNLPRDRVTTLCVIPDSFNNIGERLKELNLKIKDKYIINITGGLKPMALAVYNHFIAGRYDIKVFYFTIGANTYKQYIPLTNETPITVRTNLSLAHFFGAYGVSFEEPNQPLMSAEFTQEIYKNQLLNAVQIDNLIRYRTQHRIGKRAKFIDLNNLPIELPGLDTFIRNTLQFKTQTPDRLNEREMSYLIGGWIEEYVYYTVKQKYQIPDEQIGLNVYISRQSVVNELDVVYVKNNQLHVIECKLRLTALNVENAIYKLSSLKSGKDFGLGAKGVLVSAYLYGDNAGEIPKKFIKRADFSGITLIDPSNMDKL